MEEIIRGAGGSSKSGAGASHVPYEEPNNLESEAIASMVLVYSEGQVGGLVAGAQSIFFDGTPLQNADGSYNFQGVEYWERWGTADQEPLPFDGQEAEVQVSLPVKKALGGVTKTIETGEVDAVRINLSTNSFFQQDKSTADVHGCTVNFEVYVQPYGGNWSRAALVEIKGKTNENYIRSFTIENWRARFGAGPWNVKVVRTTDDADGLDTRNEVSWASYATITYAKLTMPNTAALGIRLAARQFGSQIPTISMLVYGKCDLKIPSNYDPRARTYTGAWDGTFKTGWTDNPAWIYYDLATSPRYGLGDYVKSWNIDKWALYEAARYCDELVPNGTGGYEPRWRFTGVLQTQEEAIHVLNSIASSFVSMPYYGSGIITLAQDRPTKPTHIANPTNVIDGLFHYTGTGNASRCSVVYVTWNDPTDHYRTNVEIVDDPELVRELGWKKKDYLAVGCTSRSQAIRMGRYILYTEKVCPEGVTFQSGLDFADCAPGCVIKASDPAYMGVDWNGRLQSNCTPTRLFLDKPVTLDAGNTYTASVVLPSGKVEEKAVYGGLGNELVPNSEFETGVTGWYPNSASSLASVDDAQFGKCCQLTFTALGQKSMKTANINLVAGVPYLLSLYIKNGTLAGKTIKASIYKSGETEHFINGGVTAEGWTHIFGYVTPQQTAPYTVWVYCWGDDCRNIASGTLLFDKISLRPTSAGETQALALTEAFSEIPDRESVWVLSSTQAEPRLFRCVANREVEPARFEVSAVFYDESKFDWIYADLPLIEKPDSIFPKGPVLPPASFSCKEFSYRNSRSYGFGMLLSWQHSPDVRVDRYEVQYRLTTGGWENAEETGSPSMEIRDLIPGTYDFRVRCRGLQNSGWTELKNVIVWGKLAPPQDVPNFDVNVVGNQAILTWEAVGDVDLDFYRIKFANVMEGATWEGAVEVATTYGTSKTLPAQVGTYLIKAVDDGGRESRNAILAVTNIAGLDGLNVVEEIEETAPFPGTFEEAGSSRTVTSNANGYIVLNSTKLVSEVARVSAVKKFSSLDAPLHTSGKYFIGTSIDLGGKFTARLSGKVSFMARDYGDLVSLWPSVSARPSITGGAKGKVFVFTYVRYKDNAADPWSDWQKFSVGDYAGRYFEFMVELVSSDSYATPVVTGIDIAVDMPDRIDGKNGLMTSATGDVTVVFDPAFHTTPAIHVTAGGMATGDYIVKTGETRTGFKFSVKNAAGTRKAVPFDYLAKGWGYEKAA